MKTQIVSFLAAIVILIMTTAAAFSQENKVDLKSPEVQKQVIDLILNDHALMQNFMEQLKTNDKAMKMVMSDMMMKCDMDASTCKNMSAIMAEHDKLLEQIGKVLDEKENSKYVVRERRYKHK